MARRREHKIYRGPFLSSKDASGEGLGRGAVESTIKQLAPYLSRGDILIDGGNSNFRDSLRRAEALQTKGIEFVDAGVSGGIWGLEAGYCLMAAAVVVGDVQNKGRLNPAARSLRTRALFSEADKVLHWAFPPGETAAGAGFFPQAVGRFGNPVAIWNDRFDLQPYDHGNYFPGLQTGTGVDDRSAQYVAQFLGAAIPLPTASNQITANSLPPENSIPSRSIG